MNIKKMYKAALLATLGLAGAATVQAATYNGDLIVGFTSQSGNDLVYDLGATSSLVDGQTWTLTSLLTGYDLNTVNWGIIGDKNVSGIRTAWMTTDGAAPSSVANNVSWGNLDNATASIYQSVGTAGAGQSGTVDASTTISWNKETLDGLTSFTSYQSYKGQSPDGAGLTSADFYSMPVGATPSLMGSFSLDNSGVLTYSATPVPEPGTLSLLGGGAFMLLALRNKFRRQ